MNVIERLEVCPIIAAVRQGAPEEALASPAEVIFTLDETVLTLAHTVQAVHACGKVVFVHADLTRGLGKDKCGMAYLAAQGVDGVISTHANLIKFAKEAGLLTVQRYFAVDSQGLDSIREMIRTAKPDFAEILPGVAEKVIRRFAVEDTPVIAAGLIETKAEVTAALSCGAAAVSTGKRELWYL